MKPMGTITKYYPFIDEESKSILNSLMDESSSYYDIVQRLSELVLENDVPIVLGYLAAVHAWWTRKSDVTDLLHEKYKDVPYICPWKYIPDITDINQELYHDLIVEAIEKALESQLDDWIETELHLLHSYFHYPYLGDIPSLLEPLDKAKSLIDSNPLLKCFESLICTQEGWAKVTEGYVDESLEVLKRGRQLAETHDDSLYKYLNLIVQESVLLYNNVKDAIELCEDLYELAQNLGVPYFMGEVFNDSAIAFETAGEYDLAISSHLEAKKIAGENDWTSQILSRIYASLGDGKRALNEINQYIENDQTSIIPNWYLRRSRALALLGRVEEAERDLDTIQAKVMKSGSDVLLGAYYHVSGEIEIARKHYPAALDILEKCWEFYERVPRVLNHNLILLDLAHVEIQIDKESRDSNRPPTPGKWLRKLERHASERDLPGVRMQAALLKSELYKNQGQLKDALGVLQDALGITDSLGVNTLQRRINERIRYLNQLLREEEMSSKKKHQ